MKNAEINKTSPRRPFAKWYTTKKCNSNCRHCFRAENTATSGTEMDTTHARIMIDRLAAMGFRLLSFGGAEPTMRKDLFELMNYARHLNLDVKLHTNGLTLASDGTKQLAESNPFEVRLSLDGVIARTNDFVRGGTSYDLVLKAIDNLHRASVPVSLATAWSKLNISEAEAMPHFLRELGIVRHHSYVLVDKGRAATDMKQFLLTELELGWVRDALRAASPESFDRAVRRLAEDLPCRRVPTAFVEVKQQGDVLFYEDSSAPWGEGIHRVGNIFDDDIAEKMDKIYSEFFDRLIDCSRCPYYATMWCIELDHYCVADLDLECAPTMVK